MTKQVMPDTNGEERDRFHESWRKCTNRLCSAHFDQDPDDFVISGDGDWISTIVCTKCMNVRLKVPDEVLAQLLHEKWWNDSSCIHVTYDHCVEFIEHRREWWTSKIKEERLL